MTCILRVAGKQLSIASLLQINLVPESTWEKGTPMRPGKSDVQQHPDSGALYLVSPAHFDEFHVQKADAVQFLCQRQQAIVEIMTLPGMERATLDFGIYWRNVPVQCDSFPPDLVRLAGRLGIGIELSQYAPEEDDENQQPH